MRMLAICSARASIGSDSSGPAAARNASRSMVKRAFSGTPAPVCSANSTSPKSAAASTPRPIKIFFHRLMGR
jgi:hypothetical protein